MLEELFGGGKPTCIPDYSVGFTQSYYFPLERDFQERKWQRWVQNHFDVIWCIFILYWLSVSLLWRFMQTRAPINLTVPLVIWNWAIAVFSFVCTFRVISERIYVYEQHGFLKSVCRVEFLRGKLVVEYTLRLAVRDHGLFWTLR